jgi:hypothetical protein
MLHALGYFRPQLTALPEAPASTNTPKIQELRKTNPAEFEKITAESRRLTTEYNRDLGSYDAEAMAAVDKFRADRKLDYQGNPAGLVDERLVQVLRAAYLEKKRSGGKN